MKILCFSDHTPSADASVISIANDVDPRAVSLEGVKRIDLNFPKFTDGRAYSQAFCYAVALAFKVKFAPQAMYSSTSWCPWPERALTWLCCAKAWMPVLHSVNSNASLGSTKARRLTHNLCLQRPQRGPHLFDLSRTPDCTAFCQISRLRRPDFGRYGQPQDLRACNGE